jgi:ABC-2 type transport system ATP-binding protein
MTAIETRDLTKHYGSLCAVDNLTLDISNEVFGLLGPNGSGKTTTVLMLTTLLSPTGGSARVCGYDVRKESAEVRRRISYVPQDMAVDIKLTGRENVLFFAKLYNVPHREEKAAEVLGIMDLSDRADDLTGTYSGGMRRRLELAQALVHEPEVLFLDEPTIGLDVAARRKIWEHITDLKDQGMTIFVTTHYMDEADHSCDRVGIIDRGRLVAVDSPRALKERSLRAVITARVEGPVPEIDLPGVSLLAADGDRVSFSASNGAGTLPLISEALVRNGARVKEISVREPTLDDVFLSVVGTPEESSRFDYTKFRTMLRRRR